MQAAAAADARAIIDAHDAQALDCTAEIGCLDVVTSL